MYRKLHRSIGIGSFIFLLIFVITGLTIQHSSWLDLDRHYIPSSLARSLYNTTVEDTIDYKIDNHWISQAGHFLYIDGLPVPYIELNNLQGAVGDETYIWVVGDNKLWLLSKQGEIVDELSVINGLPALVNKIGYNREGDIIIGGLGSNWLVDEDMQNWRTYRGAQPTWAMPADSLQMSVHLRETVLAHANNHLINWQRLLLDFHSGRLFGTAGVVIADIASLFLLFLAATGAFLWFRRA